MSMRNHILATFGWVAFCCVLLLVFGGSPAAPSQVGNTVAVDDTAVLVEPSHCVASVDEGLDWYSEGITRTVNPDTAATMKEACNYLGPNSEATLWEDGSWKVVATENFEGPEGLTKTGVWWQGCMSVTAPCAD